MENNKLTIQEALSLSLEERKNKYRALDIDKVIIDGETFDNYGTYSFLWEKSYLQEPTRSQNGSIENINDYITFLTGHLQINFSLMPVDYYRKLMRLIYEKNEHTVTCYDIVYDRQITLKMYFATEEMPKLYTIAHQLQKSQTEYEHWIELCAVEDYTVEMIGTNNDLSTLSVTYHLNPPTDTGMADKTVASNHVSGDDIIIGDGIDFTTETFGNKYNFKYWAKNADGTGGKFINNQVYTVNFDTVLYAIWERTTVLNLYLNYGLGSPKVDNGQEIHSIVVTQGKPIGTLPTSTDLPSVIYDNVTYSGENSPYSNPQWYKTPKKATALEPVLEDNILTVNSEPVTAETLYWKNTNGTIYQLYEVKKYTVTFDSNGGEGTFNRMVIKYGDEVPLPETIKIGYSFAGWYLGETRFNGTMPPKNITLVAKWK